MKDITKCLYVNLFNNEQYLQYLINKYHWAKEYCYYYLYVLHARREVIELLIQSIENIDKNKCSLKKAYYYLAKFEQRILKIATIIPTCNRPKAIKYLLEVAALGHRRRGADIIIYDSSTNNDTENVVKRIQASGYPNVKYVRYKGLFDGFSLDHKIISAYQEFQEQYDYLWICRDGLIPIIDEIFDKIAYYKEKAIDCIIVDTKSRNYGFEIEKFYSQKEDACDFLLEQADRLQTLGMLILSKKFSKYLIHNVPLDDKTYSLWQMSAPFHAFSQKPYKIIFFTRNVFANNLMASTTHFWSRAEKLFEQWAYRWTNVISNLPHDYDNVKSKCMMIYTIDFHPFSVGAVMKMRAYGGLRFSLLRKYRKYLPLVTKTPSWYIYSTCFIPKTFAKLIIIFGKRNRTLADELIKNI